MAVTEPLRKSPNSRIWFKMAERCCSRLAIGSGKGRLLILTYHHVRIPGIKKENNQTLPFASRTRLTEPLTRARNAHNTGFLPPGKPGSADRRVALGRRNVGMAP